MNLLQKAETKIFCHCEKSENLGRPKVVEKKQKWIIKKRDTQGIVDTSETLCSMV